MGDISVDLFLVTLKQLLTTSNLDFTTQEKYQLQSLEEEIKDLRGFLELVEKKRKKHPEVMKKVVQIRDVVFDAENAIEQFIVLVSKEDHASISLREHMDHPFPDLERVREDIKNLGDEVKQMYSENMYDIREVTVKNLRDSSTGSRGSSRGSDTYKVIEKNVVVGFEQEVGIVMNMLNYEGDGSLEIIAIIGAPGAGKTTLAKEVYNHRFMSFYFEICAWVDISQGYDETMKRDILVRILESVSPSKHSTDDDDKLAEYIYNCLKGKKYLIVMDDIWAIEAWNDIQSSFPKECKGSKVLFTSRLPVQPENINCVPHILAPLPKSSSWELLVKKVFGKKLCPKELVEIGKKIAQKCDGLPLAIVTIAGILATEDQILNVWEQIANNMSSIIAKTQGGCMELLELSYNHLPLRLKVCFLYVGAHPVDCEIFVRELIWLWIAEGFIQQGEGGKSLEAVAEDCLLQLIERNIVMIARRSSIGEIKTCRIHDLLRELCLKEAAKDNFFAQINGNDSFLPCAIDKHHRLFIFRQFFDKFFFSRPYPLNLRSFLCFGSRHSRIELYMSFFVETFQLLRVFSFVADECRGEILRGQLVRLRYLALRLPEGKPFSSHNPFHFLSSLEILNLQVSCMDKISLPRDIIKMVKLRHLYSKGGIFECHHVYHDEDEGNMLDSLQTLHRMCTCGRCLHFLKRTPNLMKLGLVGDPDRKGDDVLVMLELEFLKCLEILCVESVRLASTELKLPRTLTRLSLKQTNLKWEQLSILLQDLPSLEVLRLLTGACSGPVWDTSELEEGFSQLKYLKLDSLDIQEWYTCDWFPKLEVLVLEDCQRLEEIPIEFGDLNKLREIRVERCSSSVEESAKEIRDMRIEQGGDDCLNLITVGNLTNGTTEQ